MTLTKKTFDMESNSSNSSRVLSDKQLEGIRLLVVDDAKDNRLLLDRILSRNGAVVTEASNGQEAVDLALTETFDLILMDVQMPVMDGLQATRILREKGYSKAIIALTAHALVEERERCIEAGADAHVVKPINFQLLIDTIKNLIKPN